MEAVSNKAVEFGAKWIETFPAWEMTVTPCGGVILQKDSHKYLVSLTGDLAGFAINPVISCGMSCIPGCSKAECPVAPKLPEGKRQYLVQILVGKEVAGGGVVVAESAQDALFECPFQKRGAGVRLIAQAFDDPNDRAEV